MPELVEQVARHPGDPHRVRERRARLRVEVDAQLVGVVDVGAPHRPGVEGERAHVRAQTGTAISVGQISSAVRPDGNVIVDRLEVVGRPLGHPLLVERVGVPVLGPVASRMPSRTPLGQRSSAVGRSRSARMMPSATRA